MAVRHVFGAAKTKQKQKSCPSDLRDAAIYQSHRKTLLCSSPDPRILGTRPVSIPCWAVKQIYEFCQEHGVQELCAYLLENWYQADRWGLWARSAHPEIVPRLETTTMVEA